MEPSPSGAHRQRLDSWKEIARYLGRDVTTVRRWERREKLPVHRHQHHKLGSVYAYSDEIDTWLKRRSRGVAAPAADQPGPRVWQIGLGALALAGVAAIAIRPWTPVPGSHALEPAPTSIALTVPDQALVDSLELSPDGQQVAIAAVAGGESRLWIRALASASFRPLAGTEGAAFPFWSPDGAHLGFFAGGRLKHVTLATGVVRDLVDAPDGYGGSWNERDEIVFAPQADAALFRIPASGGVPVAVTSLARGAKEGHGWPEFLPNGRHVLYTNYSINRDRYGIYVLDLETGTSKRVLPVYSSASYSRDGLLFFARGALMAQPFDLTRFEVFGEPVRIAADVHLRYGVGHKAEFSVARTGLVALRGAVDERSRLTWFDPRTGRVAGTIGEPALYLNPTISRDGTQLAVTVTDPNFTDDKLWCFDLATRIGSPLTTGGSTDVGPVWSPQGDRVIFASFRRKAPGLFEHVIGIPGSDQPVLPATMQQMPESWTADGRYLTFSTMAPMTKSDVWAWELGSDRRAFPVIAGPANEAQSQVSPDGHFIAYASDESGRFEIYVQSFPDGAGKIQISRAGGADPHWRRDGRALYFIGGDRTLMVADLQAGSTLRQTQPRPLFDTGLEYLWNDTRNHFDVAPDGRILWLAPVADRRAATYTLVVSARPLTAR